MIETRVQELKERINKLIAYEQQMLAALNTLSTKAESKSPAVQKKVADQINGTQERITLYRDMLVEADLVVNLRDARALLSKFK